MSIYIEAEEWAMTAGLLGLTQLLDESQITLSDKGVTFNAESLNGLAEKYIYELIQRFSVAERDISRMNWYFNQMKNNPDRIKQYVSEIRKTMSEQVKKVKKYFEDTEEFKKLSEAVEQVKGVKKERDLPIIEKSIEMYREYASTKLINEKLTLNYVKAVILNPFFGQTSILQPSFNAKSTEEHIEQIERDFVNPAYLELKFYELMNSGNHAGEIIDFLTEHQNYKPFKDWLKKVKKLKSMDLIKQYFHEHALPCSFIDGLLATQSYEEMVFSPLALSKSKAVNFHWDFDKKQPVPMSSVARLILFMSPLGMAFYSRKVGSAQSNETLRYAGLILSQESFSNIMRLNHHYRDLRSKGSTFGEAIVNVLQESLDKAERINNSYFFLEVHSDYQAKKTLLDYYHMPAYLVRYLAEYGKGLRWLQHRDLRDAFLRTIFKGIDPIEVVFEYLREAISIPYHGQGAFHAVRERQRILQAKKGVKDMRSQDKLISFIYYRGVELREHMVNSRDYQSGDGPYRASGRKKLEGIAYRLINAVKAGNKQAFMDTIFRLYLGTDLKVPGVFVDSFKEEGLDFETIASAFIAGMLGQDSSVKKEEVLNNG